MIRAAIVLSLLCSVAHAEVSRTALDKLLLRAYASNSDAVVIYKDGALVGRWYFDKPPARMETMSITKSIVSLAIGRLIDQRRLRSLDQPVYELYPEWRQGKKAKITLRHLLSHTSGLQNEKSASLEIYPSPDVVKLALAAELTDPPGTEFVYNNKAVNLLAGIVEVASGKKVDEYVRDEIFAPLGITDFVWRRDHSGNPLVMSGLQMNAMDLAKVGLALLDGHIVSPAFMVQATNPGISADCGLLWWRQQDFRAKVADDAVLHEWRINGDPEWFLQKMMMVKDQVFTDRAQFNAAITSAVGTLAAWEANTVDKGLADGVTLPGPTTGYYSDGWLGQFLVVIPGAHLVAVRQMREPKRPFDDSTLDTFKDFPEMVKTLAQ